MYRAEKNISTGRIPGACLPPGNGLHNSLSRKTAGRICALELNILENRHGWAKRSFDSPMLKTGGYMIREPVRLIALNNGTDIRPRFTRRHFVMPEKRVSGRLNRVTVTRGAYVSAPARHSQNVVVVVRTKLNSGPKHHMAASLRGHMKYLVRDDETTGFTRDDDDLSKTDLTQATKHWSGDACYYKVVISPEAGHRLDLKDYARSCMESVEKDLLTDAERRRGMRLEWVAAQHWDTDHPHVHVAVRGFVDGRNLRMSDGYLTQGFRNRARKIATAKLGFRRDVDGDERSRLIAIGKQREKMGLDRETGSPVNSDDVGSHSLPKREQARDGLEI